MRGEGVKVLMLEILSLKSCIREFQVSVEYRWGGKESGGWRISFSNVNSDLLFPSLEMIRPEEWFVLA